MSKYVIEVEEKDMMFDDIHHSFLVMNDKVKSFEEAIKEETQRSAEEAWKLVGKIIVEEHQGGMSFSELVECFGIESKSYRDVLKLPYSKVRQKYDDWKKKKEKEEIRVGDEISCDGVKFFITRILNTCNDLCGINANGDTFCILNCKNKEWVKTGRHFDQIEELLKAMKEGE